MFVDYGANFIERLIKLRMRKKVSAREMSLALGQSKGYIAQIERGHNLPSMSVFFYICDYLKITPRDFFDEGNSCPEQLQELMEDLKKLDPKTITYITGIVKEILKK